MLFVWREFSMMATELMMAYTYVYANSLEIIHATDSQDFHE
jgi:hypothetical protein